METNKRRKLKRTIGWTIVILFVLLLTTLTAGSFYMLDYSLAPTPERRDTAQCFSRLYDEYPETRPWADSLKAASALRDTFVVMPTGERHHALYINTGSNKTALVLHGWRGCSIDMLFIGRIYDQVIGGYNVVLPDFHAHGLSDGEMIQMGWLDRQDMLRWLSLFKTDTMVVHGISMGGATTMMLSAETLPAGIKDIRFVDDCGYTSVWDEFSGEMRNQFGLPPFPLIYTASLLCQLRYGWSFSEASALRQVSRSPHPMLFIHGGSDDFVPTEMVYRLHAAKAGKKGLWVAEGAAHAQAYAVHREEYVRRLRQFLSD